MTTKNLVLSYTLRVTGYSSGLKNNNNNLLLQTWLLNRLEIPFKDARNTLCFVLKVDVQPVANIQ